MLRSFIAANRGEILSKVKARVSARGGPVAEEELTNGLPVFLDQVGDALRKSALHEVFDHAEIINSAARHGDHFFEQGMTVAQVINGYGDLCQVITGMAFDRKMAIAANEFQTLNLCVDEATAGAVAAYSSQREQAISSEGTERLGFLAHELRNALNAAILAFGLVKRGAVATAGSTSATVDRSHMRLQALIDRSLADVRLDAGMLNMERVPVWEILQEAEIGASIVAQSRGVVLTVTTVEPTVIVEADRPVLTAALSNLLQNAIKFTLPATKVNLRARATASRVLIDVEDACGGLPPGAPESLLKPFIQKGRDRTGLGLGLFICLKAVKSMAGELHIQDHPGKGCIFTIDLPRQPPPSPSSQALIDRASGGSLEPVGPIA